MPAMETPRPVIYSLQNLRTHWALVKVAKSDTGGASLRIDLFSSVKTGSGLFMSDMAVDKKFNQAGKMQTNEDLFTAIYQSSLGDF